MSESLMEAIKVVAKEQKWNKLAVHDLHMLLWCLFRYYAMRCFESTTAQVHIQAEASIARKGRRRPRSTEQEKAKYAESTTETVK